MHSYLRAIGFSNPFLCQRDVERLLDDVFSNFDDREAIKFDESNRAFVELSKNYGPDIGIKVCGEMDEYGFHRQYYYPYLRGSGVTTAENITIERRVSGDSYTGVCEDPRVGCSLIFYLQNPALLAKQSYLKDMKHSFVTATFSALSVEGKILLPAKSEGDRKNEKTEESQKTKDDFLNLYSIVDTCFAPYGMECDRYMIIGYINTYQKVCNDYTREELYQMNIRCNDMNFDICINRKDLLGDPEEGRRFKGTIWLQGRLNF